MDAASTQYRPISTQNPTGSEHLDNVRTGTPRPPILTCPFTAARDAATTIPAAERNAETLITLSIIEAKSMDALSIP